MVGLIHRLFFDHLEEAAGAATAAAVKRRVGIPEDKTYRMDEFYPELEWQQSLAAACEELDAERESLIQSFAQFFIDDAHTRWPIWFEMAGSAREFLERQVAIHNGFATGVKDPESRAKVRDKFRLESLPDALVVHYRSPNQLCDFYRALAGIVLGEFGEHAKIDEVRCQLKGDPECEMHIRWMANS